MLMFCILKCCSLIFWSYNAGLVSILAVEVYILPVRSIEELADKTRYWALVLDGTANVDYFRRANPERHPLEANIWREVCSM
jgi:hypothetical protein